MERSIFALEICLVLDPSTSLQHDLRQLITTNSEKLSYQRKWQIYQQASYALLSHRHLWHRGCWDFFDDDTKAQNDFRMWVNGMLTEEGARKSPSGLPDPYRGQPRYMTFTIACLLVQNSDTELAMARVCKIPQAMLWHRSTFERVLEGFGGSISHMSKRIRCISFRATWVGVSPKATCPKRSSNICVPLCSYEPSLRRCLSGIAAISHITPRPSHALFMPTRVYQGSQPFRTSPPQPPSPTSRLRRCVERGEPEKTRLFSPSPRSIAKQCGVERGLGG